MKEAFEISSESEAQTKTLAAKLATQLILPGDAMILTGSLGSGKTVFAKACGKVFCQDETIQSPTYSLMHLYPITSLRNGFSDRSYFCHLDFYRMNSPDECYALGWFDYLESGEHFSLVEWGERFLDVFEGIPENRLWVLSFEVLQENSRKVFIKAPTDRKEKVSAFLG